MAFKIKKPNTPGQRNQVSLDFSHLGIPKSIRGRWSPIIKRLSKGKNSKGGRNNTGQITVWSRGGGHKRKYRRVLFKRDILIKVLGEVQEKSEVIGLFYDPNRSNYLAFIRLSIDTSPQISKKTKIMIEKAGIYSLLGKDEEEGDKGADFWYYILAPKGLKVGDKLPLRYRSKDLLVHGEAIPVENLPLGTLIYNISYSARAAGSFGQILENSPKRKEVRIRLPSKQRFWLPYGSFVTVGTSGNEDHRHINLGKAGRSRWLSRRPKVRGVAINPVDHPHGGGEGRSSGGRPSVTPWGRPTRNWTAKKNKKK